MPAVSPSTSQERWHNMGEDDIGPLQPVFRPSRIPGPKLVTTTSVLQTIVQHTNAYVFKKHLWRRLEVLPGTCCVHGPHEGLCCD